MERFCSVDFGQRINGSGGAACREAGHALVAGEQGRREPGGLAALDAALARGCRDHRGRLPGYSGCEGLSPVVHFGQSGTALQAVQPAPLIINESETDEVLEVPATLLAAVLRR